MTYIDTKYLGKCETCRHHSNSGCNTYCDHGEEYSPNLSKIPTADVVEVVRCKGCKYYKPYAKPVEDFDGECIVRECETDENEFCSYGTPKERGTDE